MKATVLLVTALLVVGAAAPMAVAASTADGPAAAGSVAVQDGDAANETDNETETAPGAQLAGVVDVQGAEVEGEVEQRSFGLQVAAANSNASKASVVANHTQTLDQRLEALRERKQELEAARENGSISEGRYRAEMAGLAARVSTLQSMTNETAETARSLPEEALAERGVNVSALERLRTSASNLSGPEVAAIARNIAGVPGNNSTGPPFGNGMAGPPVDTPATPGDEENETAYNETNPGEGGAPDNPGTGPDAPVEEDGKNETATSPGEGDTPGNSPGASGNGPGANVTNETSDEPGPPDNPGNGNGNGPLIDLSVLAPLLP
ncbi:hypothetical protein [Halobacterium noricense]|uniref:hypothetical protein n=1 Tax=Halobacterium noricense TaxID=223182 RepID=UPI001E2C3F9A|nr:hypothetical protein [Halobacterium noricense]UHH25486.1 hypothetical protein LT974_00740 [Halobacterium noricense]